MKPGSDPVLRESFLREPETWQAVAEAIGEHDYTYDLSDMSHRLDVVQIVCMAAAKISEKKAVEYLRLLKEGGWR